VEAGEVGIFAILGGSSVALVGFALRAPIFFFLLPYPSCLLSVAFRRCCFSWSSDDALLRAFHAQVR